MLFDTDGSLFQVPRDFMEYLQEQNKVIRNLPKGMKEIRLTLNHRTAMAPSTALASKTTPRVLNATRYSPEQRRQAEGMHVEFQDTYTCYYVTKTTLMNQNETCPNRIAKTHETTIRAK